MNSNQAENNAVSTAAATACAAQSLAPDKPRKPTPVKARLEYIEFFEKYTRAACNVAHIYSFLVFRCQRNKTGDVSARLEVIREGGRWGERAFWYLHTPEDIARECGKSVDKVESALKILKRLNMIEARAGRHPINGEVIKYRGKTVTHIRLGVCQRANGLDAWPSVDQIDQLRIIPGTAVAVPISLAEAVLLLQDASEVGDASKGKATSASAKNTGGIPESHQGETKNQTAIPDEVQQVKCGEPAPDGVHEAAPKLLGYAVLWQELFGLEMDETYSNMLKLAATKLWAGEVRGAVINPTELIKFLHADTTALTWGFADEKDHRADADDPWLLRLFVSDVGLDVIVKAFVAAGGKPKVKKMKMAGATQPKPAEPAPALASAPCVPPVALASQGTNQAPVQTATAPAADAVSYQEFLFALRDGNILTEHKYLFPDGWCVPWQPKQTALSA